MLLFPAFVTKGIRVTIPDFGSIFPRNTSTVKGPVDNLLLMKCMLGNHFF